MRTPQWDQNASPIKISKPSSFYASLIRLFLLISSGFILLLGGALAQSVSISIHPTTETTGRQGNLLTFLARHEGSLPSNPHMFFYVVDSLGVTQNLGYQSTPVVDLWSKNWIAKSPGTYRVYAVLRTGWQESSTEVARTQMVPVTIQGSSISIHSSTHAVITGGKESMVVAKTSGRLYNPHVFFYAYDVNTEVTYRLGYTSTETGSLWSKKWTPPHSGTFYLYAVLRTGYSETSTEAARTGNFTLVPVGTKPPLPFAAAADTYHALVASAERPLLTVQVSASGQFTGRMLLQGLAYSFRGTLASDGTASIRSDLKKHPSLILSLRVSPDTKMVAGTYQLGQSAPVLFSLLPSAYTGKTGSVSPLNKRTLNMLLFVDSITQGVAAGHGYAQISIAADGGARIAGRMPDGRTLTTRVPALGTGLPGVVSLPVSVVWKGRELDALAGDLEIAEMGEGTGPDIEGQLLWDVASNLRRAIPPQAFSAQIVAAGTLWASPAARTNLLTNGNDTIEFELTVDQEAALFTGQQGYPGTWGADNKPQLTSLPARSNFKVAAKTGMLSGVIPLPPLPGKTSTKGKIRGLMLSTPVQSSHGATLHGAGQIIGNGGAATIEILTD
jgi:hypothetical protein